MVNLPGRAGDFHPNQNSAENQRFSQYGTNMATVTVVLEVELQLDFEDVLIEQPQAAYEGRGERVATAEAIVGLDLEVMVANVEIEADAEPIQLVIADDWIERFIPYCEFRARIAGVKQVAELYVPAVRNDV